MRIPRPSPSMAVSLLALVVAMGSGAYAVSLPPNSIGPSEIRANAVGDPEIRRNAISSDEIRNGGVESQDLELPGVGGLFEFPNFGLPTSPAPVHATQEGPPITLDERTFTTPATVRDVVMIATIQATAAENDPTDEAEISLVVQATDDGGGLCSYSQTIEAGQTEVIPYLCRFSSPAVGETVRLTARVIGKRDADVLGGFVLLTHP